MLKDLADQVQLIWDALKEYFRDHCVSREVEPEKLLEEPKVTSPQLLLRPRETTQQGMSMPIAPTNSIEFLHRFLNDNKDVLHRFVVKQVKMGIQHNLSSIDLFRVGHTPIIARIDSKEYDLVLTDAQNYFVGEQEFELAQQCIELRDKNSINKLLKSV